MENILDITKLKSEMFDIIREQEKLKRRVGELQQVLIDKEKILVNLEQNTNIKIGEVLQ